ncbi:pseudouridine synthase [Asticcacaulis sp. AND118]|uniref:pseudouridine synthase n=1 Tax=Asticcacaulis sp. AND118 TaxID=2840468 RepID=UPI001CFFD964|nr:pseudouridine synthase [Asticcacaulis sp. AND118]UDF04491.1 pseudouridine synthase [Asticcacaulis sp. AND118]
MSEDNSTPESVNASANSAENAASEAAPAKKSYVKKPFAKKGPADKSFGKPARPPERIAKVLARAGLASRREVERLIGLGKIAVNGRLLDTPATTVSAEDVITVEGKPIRKAEPTRVWRYHKPVGLMTTHQDPQGRPTVFNSLPEELPRVISVGRLDINSEGLLLLTNDGELARALELPTTGWTRVYRVRALGRTTQEALDTLKNGVTVEGVQYGPIEARLDKAQEKADGRANLWITVSLNEGKNREVRKVLDSLGLKVNRLIRLAYGPFQLGDIEPGEVEEIGPRVVRELLGEKIDPRNLPPEGETQTRTPMRLRRTDGEGTGGRRGGGERFAARGEGRPDREERRERPVSKEEAFRRKYEAKNFGDRDFDERPRFEGDGPARDRRPEREEREWKPRAERPRGEFKPRSEGGFKSRGEGDFKPRGDRNFGDRPQRDFKPRGEGEFKPRGDRPQRDFKPRGEGDFKPRGERSFGDKPRFDKPRGERSFGDRPPRDFKPRAEGDFKPRGDRPQRDFKPRGESDAPRGDFKPRFDKPRGERSFGDRPQRDFKPRGEGDFKPRSDRPQRDFKPRGEGDAPRGDFKPRFDKPRGERSFGDRPQRDFKPRGEGDFKPRSDRPAGKSFGGKPDGGKSFGGKPGGFKPGGRPAGRTGGFSGGPRKPRPE